MRSCIPALTLAAIVVPVLAAKTWDVNIVNNPFSTAIIDIAPGDTVRWSNADGPDHAFVQTEPGHRLCTLTSGGFNSGRKVVSKSYQHTLQSEGKVSYKDNSDASCAKLNSTGTIYVEPRPADAIIEKINAAYGELTTTLSGSTSATETANTAGAASTLHGASVIPTQIHKSAASGLLAQGPFIFGLVALAGMLVAF